MLAITPLQFVPYRRLDLSERLGLWCLIDEDDYPWISQHRWNYGWWANTRHKKYPKRNVGTARSTVYLHREVQKRADPRSEEFMSARLVDHINGQPLDARKINLRWATHTENTLNRIPWHEVPSVEEIAAGLDAARASAGELAPAPF